MSFNIPKNHKFFVTASALAALLMGLPIAFAQPTLVSSVPANFATGVSPSAAVVFTFSEAMDPANTSVLFLVPPFTQLGTVEAWSANNTVLTCTPNPVFPSNTNIIWNITGQNPAGDSLSGNSSGFFTTGGGSGGGGSPSGTNATTSFAVGKLYLNEQTNASAPTPIEGTFGAYDITASTSLSSNRAASGITMTLPGGSTVKNLSQNPTAHEDYFFYDFNFATASSFEAAYPQGDYVFNVTGTPANLQATVTLPTTMAQPNAPHLLNFNAAQAVDATQPFTVKWDPFTNGTAADVITLAVDNGSTTVFATPSPGTNGALSGTALSVTIPAGKLQAGITNDAQLTFYRYVITSNANYTTFGFRATSTQFSLITSSGVAGPTPVVSNPSWGSNGFGFDVATVANQALKVRYSTNCALPIAEWQTLLTTNSPGATVHLNVPVPAGTGFLRLQNGP